MRQAVLIASLAVTFASAFLLYSTVVETRQLALRLNGLERALERAEADVAVLRAERAWLARPERIEEQARRLGLAPASPNGEGRK